MSLRVVQNEQPALDEGVAVLMNSLDANWKDIVLAPGESIKPGKWELTGAG